VVRQFLQQATCPTGDAISNAAVPAVICVKETLGLGLGRGAKATYVEWW
jgi:hypothetical protein